MPKVKIKDIEFGSEALPLVAGPCVIESRDHTLFMAEKILEITSRLSVPFVFKSSFDKANRTSLDSFRGPGPEEGLAILSEVREKFSVPVLTDIHLPSQAREIADVADVIQIPAFLCRQTDILLAAGKTGAVVNIKKGQFLAPEKMRQIIEKVESTGNRKILLTERGTTFGYSELINDMRSIPIMKETGYPVIFDGTHSAQMPGREVTRTGGNREFIPTLVNSAVAAGCDALFLEVHNNVKQAMSDASTQWPLDRLEELLARALRVREAVLDHD